MDPGQKRKGPSIRAHEERFSSEDRVTTRIEGIQESQEVEMRRERILGMGESQTRVEKLNLTLVRRPVSLKHRVYGGEQGGRKLEK